MNFAIRTVFLFLGLVSLQSRAEVLAPKNSAGSLIYQSDDYNTIKEVYIIEENASRLEAPDAFNSDSPAQMPAKLLEINAPIGGQPPWTPGGTLNPPPFYPYATPTPAPYPPGQVPGQYPGAVPTPGPAPGQAYPYPSPTPVIGPVVQPTPIVPPPGGPGGPLHPPPPPTSPSITGDVGGIIGAVLGPADIQAWVTIGMKVWDIIVANKPSASTTAGRISVLPMAQADWAKMDSWQGPMTKTYTIRAVNMLGSVIVSHTYTIAFNYNGQLAGAGHYISNATMIPSAVNVSWGYSLNSKVEFNDAVNTGTAANPLPGISIQLDWAIDSLFKHSEGVETYFIKGDGSISRVNP